MQTFDVEFKKDGRVFSQDQVDAVLNSVSQLSDLIVISHGWNNDRADAKKLYEAIEASITGVVPLVDGADALKLGVLRVFWPSKKFADRDLIPGGGAASAEAQGENVAGLTRLLDELSRDPERLGEDAVDARRREITERAKALIPKLSEPDSQRQFVELIRELLDRRERETDDGSEAFFSRDAVTLFADLLTPIAVTTPVGAGGAASLGDSGGAAGFVGDLVGGVVAAARRVANFATYYQMKSRAGLVGRSGLAGVLAKIREKKADLPIHLVGHSFGGRLVTAAAAEFPPKTTLVTLTLLQAAFSHNGFSTNFDDEGSAGAFARVLSENRISGPVVVTHTKNDRAVGIAYPIASRIARQSAAALGDANDPYGGLGRNGALHLSDAIVSTLDLKPLKKSSYKFQPNKVYNLRSDQFIKDHSDVATRQVAQAVLSCVCATRKS